MGEVALLTGQYRRECETLFDPKLQEFCTLHGLILQHYMDAFHWGLHGLLNTLQSYNGHNIDHMRQEFHRYKDEIERTLVNVPADDPDVMMPPQSPFQTYIRLLAICGNTATRLELFDPYLDAEVFHRYLPGMRTGVEITLVTEVANMRNPRRRDRIVAISELVALERPAQYRLPEAPRIHDRHLRSDEKIFHLGGSPKDASKMDFLQLRRPTATKPFTSHWTAL